MALVLCIGGLRNIQHAHALQHQRHSQTAHDPAFLTSHYQHYKVLLIPHCILQQHHMHLYGTSAH
jgi:hypothetical protein